MDPAHDLDDAAPAGRHLHALLLAALASDRPLARLDLRVGSPWQALVLHCDVAPAAPARPAAGRLRVVARARCSGPLDDFIDALARGPARGIVFRAATTARAVFRGSIGTFSVRLAVAELDANSRWNDLVGAASMAPVSPRWRPSW